MSLGGALRRVYQFAKNDVLFGTLLYAYGRRRHRALLRRAVRSNSHTYTCFYRSPPQLDALCGPVLEHLETRARGRDLRIVLFAASNGAEPYSLASELVHRRPDVSFRIHASDLHASMVEKAQRGVYSIDEITQSVRVPAEFIARTFERLGDSYVVKPHIRERVQFEQADLLDALHMARFRDADIVSMQNVLFHLPPELARRAFANGVRLLTPGAVFLVEGMDPDMRAELTRAAGLMPLEYRLKEIYVHSRFHIPTRWWNYYYGMEPYSIWARDRSARYGSIFFASDTTGAHAAEAR